MNEEEELEVLVEIEKEEELEVVVKEEELEVVVMEEEELDVLVVNYNDSGDGGGCGGDDIGGVLHSILVRWKYTNSFLSNMVL